MEEHKTEVVQEGNDRYLRCSCGRSLSTYNQADRHIERAKSDHLRTAVEVFLNYEDTHEPGPFVKDGNWHSGAEKIAPDGFQICADEDCGAYWPCPTEQLRRAFEGSR